MTISQIKAAGEIMIVAANGAPIQCRRRSSNCINGWSNAISGTSFEWNWRDLEYRVARFQYTPYTYDTIKQLFNRVVVSPDDPSEWVLAAARSDGVMLLHRTQFIQRFATYEQLAKSFFCDGEPCAYKTVAND